MHTKNKQFHSTYSKTPPHLSPSLLIIHSMASSFSYLVPLLPLLLLLLLLLDLHVVSSSLLVVGKGHHNQLHRKKPALKANQTTCDLFAGSWVLDESYPLYQSSSCPTIIDPEFNCQMFGRPDSGYQRYRWTPMNCELPRFSAVNFLSKMRGKTVMFAGDSLGRNQWESLICMLNSAVSASQTQMIRGDPLSTFKFLSYGVSISFYRAPYLVDIDSVGGKRILKLEDISGNARAWRGVDVLSFNSGHWWTHKGGLQGWDYMEIGGNYYADMDRLVAFGRGLTTWAKWVDTSVDTAQTRVFFQGISPTHYNPTEWNGPVSKNCYGETSPVSGGTYTGTYPDQMKIVNSVIRNMTTLAYLLDVTTLSELRKDGHPSIYSGNLSPEQRANPDRSADCSHWCLPGLPDTWNELLYTALLF